MIDDSGNKEDDDDFFFYFLPCLYSSAAVSLSSFIIHCCYYYLEEGDVVHVHKIKRILLLIIVSNKVYNTVYLYSTVHSIQYRYKIF